MFPWVHEFRWEIGHLIFTGGFTLVLITVIAAVTLVFKKVRDIYKLRQVEKIAWQAAFEDFPAHARACRHAISGVLMERVCNNHFDCGACAVHKQLVDRGVTEEVLSSAGEDGTAEIFGLSVPLDRMYHRGHTWVKRDKEGNYLVGMDDFGRRLIGTADEIRFPETGSRVYANGTAWRVKRGDADTRILSPVDGEVLETGGDEKGWYLKIRPIGNGAETSHLLTHGKEIRAWCMRELERLQFALASDGVGASLADGGVLTEDLPKSHPDADWDGVYGEIFLEP